MPNSQATIENLLKWKTDQASVDAAVRANQRIEASSNRAAVQFGNASEAAQALGLSTAQMQQLGLATEKTAQSVGFLTQRLEQAARVRSFQGDATGGLRDAVFGGSTGGNDALVRGLFNARQAAIALPGVGYQSPLTIGIRGLEIAAEKTGASVGKLATGVGIAGAAFGAVYIALEAFNKALDTNRQRLAAALEAQKAYYDAVAQSTTEQVNAQIDALQRARPALEAALRETQNAIISAFGERVLTDPLGVGRFERGVAKILSPDLFTALEDQSKALQENIDLETRLTQGRSAGAFAANDAAAAEAELQRQRELASQEITSNQVNLAREAARAQTLTSDEREKEISALEVQKSALEAAINTYGLSGSAVSQLNDYIDQLDNQIVALSDTTLSYADVLKQIDDQQASLKTQTDNYFDALQREGDIRDALAQNQQDVAEALADYNRKRLQENADYNERIAELETDSADRRAEIAQDAQDRIAEIESQAAIDRAEAIGYRDADALRKANERAAQQKKQVDKQEDRQIDNLEKSLDKQVRTAQRSYERQQRDLEAAKNREIYALQGKYQRLQADLTNAIYAEQQIALTGAGTQRIIHTQMWQDLNYLAVSWVFNTVNTVRSILQNSGFFGASVNGSQVQQIATQAARQYLNDRLVGGRWITA